MSVTSKHAVGVVGAGAMGAGIAQVAARFGHEVFLADTAVQSLDIARTGHGKAMSREVEKGRMTQEQADETLARVHYVDAARLDGFAQCALVIEAAVERLDVKRDIFRRLELVVGSECMLASNTSSLSIASIAGVCTSPARVLGIHFFNPAPVMPLVEIIPSLTTSPEVTAAATSLMASWGKTTVIASDTPGFIVNRIARPFYGEALRIHDEGLADIPTIDWAMRDVGGFRMGPFELMDFIGNDINFAVTTSVFESMFYDARYRPSHTQRQLVEAGMLGRKSGRGYYDYRAGATPPQPRDDRALAQDIVDRVLAMLINEAVDALMMRVANARDIEVAMTRGVNYPKGLLAWCDEIGPAVIVGRIDALYDRYREDRYRTSPLLRTIAQSGGKVLA